MINEYIGEQYAACRYAQYSTAWTRQYDTQDAALLGPALPLVTRPVLNKECVLVPLVPRLEASFGWSTPWTDGMDVTLRFTSTTTVRMIGCSALVHFKTRPGEIEY